MGGTVIPALCRLRQDGHNFGASLGFIMNSRPTWNESKIRASETMAQLVRLLQASLMTLDPHSGRRDPAPPRCPVTSTHMA